MHIIRGIAVAFSTYSKIPMPQFVWKEEDMRYSMCFFPWIGAVIGAILWGWFRLSALLGISTLAFILISAALPLIITGGFHVDGFMDTMDAIMPPITVSPITDAALVARFIRPPETNVSIESAPSL